MGMALNLEERSVSAVLLGDDRSIKEGDQVKTTGRIVEVPVGETLFGRVVDALGRPLDGKGPVVTSQSRPIEQLAPTVLDRQPVKEPLQTGLKAIDSITPIGRGQRELIIGDRQTGKTAVAVDAIINQKDTDVFCIYVAIGQKQSTVRSVVDVLQRTGAMEYTVVVSATASAPASQQYIAPYAGCAIGEYMRDMGKHCLVVYDDLSKHAQAYRQISLLLRRPPGREGLPGDIFNLHSRLLGARPSWRITRTRSGRRRIRWWRHTNRAAHHRDPGRRLLAHIPTNVISITDGQIYLETDLFYAGQRPAINVGVSVSRVGGNAQVKAMRKVSGRLRLIWPSIRSWPPSPSSRQTWMQTRAQLDRGERLLELLKQEQYAPMSVTNQVIMIFAGTEGHLDRLPADQVRAFEPIFLRWITARHPEITEALRTTSDLTDDLRAGLEAACKQAVGLWLDGRLKVEAEEEAEVQETPSVE